MIIQVIFFLLAGIWVILQSITTFRLASSIRLLKKVTRAQHEDLKMLGKVVEELKGGDHHANEEKEEEIR